MVVLDGYVVEFTEVLLEELLVVSLFLLPKIKKPKIAIMTRP